MKKLKDYVLGLSLAITTVVLFLGGFLAVGFLLYATYLHSENNPFEYWVKAGLYTFAVQIISLPLFIILNKISDNILKKRDEKNKDAV